MNIQDSTPGIRIFKGRGRPSKNLMEDTYNYFKDIIDKMNIENIKKLADFILKRTVVVSVIVGHDSDPFTIFDANPSPEIPLSPTTTVYWPPGVQINGVSFNKFPAPPPPPPAVSDKPPEPPPPCILTNNVVTPAGTVNVPAAV